MALCFISHKSEEDDQVADRVATELSRHGIEPWIDHQQIQPSMNWTETVGQALFRCDFGIYLLSARSAVSEQCQSEAITIKDARKAPLYVAFIEEVAASATPYWVRARSYVDLQKDWRTGMDQVIASMRARAALPATLPLVAESPAEAPHELEPVPFGWRRMMIWLEDRLDEVRPNLDTLVTRLCERLGIDIDLFRVVSVSKGSTALTVDVRQSDADQLLAIAEQEPDLFAGFTLASIQVMRPSYQLPSFNTLALGQSALYDQLFRQGQLGRITNLNHINLNHLRLNLHSQAQSGDDEQPFEKGYFPFRGLNP